MTNNNSNNQSDNMNVTQASTASRPKVGKFAPPPVGKSKLIRAWYECPYDDEGDAKFLSIAENVASMTAEELRLLQAQMIARPALYEQLTTIYFRMTANRPDHVRNMYHGH